MYTNEKGGIAVSSQQQKVKESILMILSTRPGERVMRPNFGCRLYKLAFHPNNTGTANLARHYVEEALATWEPRIILREIVVQNDRQNNRLLIDMQYVLKSTYEPQNLVFPFYLEQT